MFYGKQGFVGKVPLWWNKPAPAGIDTATDHCVDFSVVTSNGECDGTVHTITCSGRAMPTGTPSSHSALGRPAGTRKARKALPPIGGGVGSPSRSAPVASSMSAPGDGSDATVASTPASQLGPSAMGAPGYACPAGHRVVWRTHTVSLPGDATTLVLGSTDSHVLPQGALVRGLRICAGNDLGAGKWGDTHAAVQLVRPPASPKPCSAVPGSVTATAATIRCHALTGAALAAHLHRHGHTAQFHVQFEWTHPLTGVREQVATAFEAHEGRSEHTFTLGDGSGSPAVAPFPKGATLHSITVVALNEAGASDATVPLPDIKLRNVPGAPLGLMAAAEGAEETPAANTMMSFVLDALPSGKRLPNGCTLRGVRIRAINAMGVGAYSNTLADIVLRDVPPPPTNLRLLAPPTCTSIDVTWDAPEDDSVVSFLVAYCTKNPRTDAMQWYGASDSGEGGVSVTYLAGASADTPRCRLDGLPIGCIVHGVCARAENIVGFGDFSDAMADVTLPVPPPTGLAVEQDSIRTQSMMATWDTPPSDYHVQTHVVEFTTSDGAHHSVTALPKVVDAMDPRRLYLVLGDGTTANNAPLPPGSTVSALCVAAVTSVGVNAFCEPHKDVQLRGVPAKPRGLKVKSVDGTVLTVQWDEPADRLDEVTHHVIEYSFVDELAGDSTVQTPPPVTIPYHGTGGSGGVLGAPLGLSKEFGPRFPLGCVVHNLRVTAVNVVGASDPCKLRGRTTLLRPPAIPTDLRIEPQGVGRDTLHVSWAPVADSDRVQRYHLVGTAKPADGGAAYTFEEEVDNRRGARTDHVCGTGATPRFAVASPGGVGTIISQLRVRAINEQGESPFSAVLEDVELLAPPSVPVWDKPVWRHGFIVFRWQPSTGRPAAPVDGYTVTYTLLSAREGGVGPVPPSVRRKETRKTHSIASDTCTLEVTNVPPGTIVHDVRVEAHSAGGKSGPSKPLPDFALPTPPAAVRELQVAEITGHDVTVTWRVPEDDGGAPVREYEVMYTSRDTKGVIVSYDAVRVKAADGVLSAVLDGKGPTIDHTSSGSAAMGTGLAVGTEVDDIHVRAKNTVGASVPVYVKDAVRTHGPPSAVLDPAVDTVNDTSLVLQWGIPQYDGGHPITTYTVTFDMGDDKVVGEHGLQHFKHVMVSEPPTFVVHASPDGDMPEIVLCTQASRAAGARRVRVVLGERSSPYASQNTPDAAVPALPRGCVVRNLCVVATNRYGDSDPVYIEDPTRGAGGDSSSSDDESSGDDDVVVPPHTPPRIVVKLLDVPQPPQSLQLLYRTDTELAFSWVPPTETGGCELLPYVLQYQTLAPGAQPNPDAAAEEQNVPVSSTEMDSPPGWVHVFVSPPPAGEPTVLVLGGLKREQEVRGIQVCAVNKVGRSTFVLLKQPADKHVRVCVCVCVRVCVCACVLACR